VPGVLDAPRLLLFTGGAGGLGTGGGGGAGAAAAAEAATVNSCVPPTSPIPPRDDAELIVVAVDMMLDLPDDFELVVDTDKRAFEADRPIWPAAARLL